MRYQATAAGPGLTTMIGISLQGLIDACLDWPAKAWEISVEGGEALLRIPASVPVQLELFT